MGNVIDQEALTNVIRAIPRGKVTTYGLLAAALGAGSWDQIAWLGHSVCQETAALLLAGGATTDAVLPCWRIVGELPSGQLSPTTDPLVPADPLYRVVIQPLLDDGIAIAPPTYEIPRGYLHYPGHP